MPVPDASTDHSPGLSRPYRARDGGLIRLRIPGGRTTSQVLHQIADVSAEHADGLVQLTTRGNIQLRTMRLDADDQVSTKAMNALVATGIVPYSHERVRTILCSPLPSDEHPDLHPMVTELDDAILAEPALADLPGSFVWAFDNGRGDIAAERWDLCYQATGPAAGLLSTSTGDVWPVLARQVVPTMVALASEFAQLRRHEDPAPLHAHQLGFRQRARYSARLAVELGEPGSRRLTLGPRPYVGPVGRDLLAGVPLGLLSPEMVESLPRGPVTLTPWRQILVPGAAAEIGAYARAGFAVDPTEPWAHVSACIGSGGCTRTGVDTLAMAERLVEAVNAGEAILTEDLHISGCERRCGAPHREYIDIVNPRHLFVAIDEIEERRYRMESEQQSAREAR